MMKWKKHTELAGWATQSACSTAGEPMGLDSDVNRQQYEQLSALVNGASLNVLRGIFLAAAVGLGGYGLATGRHGATMLGVFCGIVTAGTRQIGRHLRNAERAFHSPDIDQGRLTITTSCWSDVVHYHANVRSVRGDIWTFEFMPLGWTPAEGEFDADLHYLPGVAWPALAAIPEGLIYPRHDPVAKASG
jgi:hypothetical protein